MDLKGSTFVVTGGASGLGAATVRMVVAGGGNAVIADLKEAEGQALAAELGRAARFVRTDVADEASMRAAVAAAVDGYGGLQGLVSCAGIVHGEKVVGKEGPHSLAGFARTISINLVGMFNAIRLAADAMGKGTPNAGGERGVIVNTASVAAFDGQIGQAAYAASKGGIVAMTRTIARHFGRDNITAFAVAPGFVRTNLNAAFFRDHGVAAAAEGIPLGEIAEPQDIANTIAFLASGLARHATGTTIDINGASYVR